MQSEDIVQSMGKWLGMLQLQGFHCPVSIYISRLFDSLKCRRQQPLDFHVGAKSLTPAPTPPRPPSSSSSAAGAAAATYEPDEMIFFDRGPKSARRLTRPPIAAVRHPRGGYQRHSLVPSVRLPCVRPSFDESKNRPVYRFQGTGVPEMLRRRVPGNGICLQRSVSFEFDPRAN